MTKHKSQLLTLGELINLMEPAAGRWPEDSHWFERMPAIDIPGLAEVRERIAAINEACQAADNPEFDRLCEEEDRLEAEYIREHENDKYVISWPEHVINPRYDSDANYLPAGLDDEIEACEDLDDLCRLLNTARDERPDEYRELDCTELPTFGGADVEDTVAVFSWDEDRLLIQGEAGWEIIDRCPTCGEAPFHCHHED